MTTTLKRDDVVTAIDGCEFGMSHYVTRLDTNDDHPLIASKGAGSIHVLRRRRGKGWQYLGYAVWSCRQQAWVCGSWRHPVSIEQATRHLRNMAWEG